MDAPDRFDPWPPGIEPEVPIHGYPNTWTFTPAQPLLRRVVDGLTSAEGEQPSTWPAGSVSTCAPSA